MQNANTHIPTHHDGFAYNNVVPTRRLGDCLRQFGHGKQIKH